METNWKRGARMALTWLGALALSALFAFATLVAVLYIFSRGAVVPARHLLWGSGVAFTALAVIACRRDRRLKRMRGSLVAAALLLWLVAVGCEGYHRTASLPGIGDPHEGRAVRVLVAELAMGVAVPPRYRTHRVWIRPCRARLLYRDLDATCPDGRPGIFLQHDIEPVTTDLATALGRLEVRALVVSVHGFNVKADEAAARLTTALDDAGAHGAAAPTVLGVVWPSETYPQEYRIDAAKVRSPELVRGLAAVLRAIPHAGERETTLVAHSAGNVLLAGALAQPGVRTSLHVRTTISLNSDLPLDDLAGYLGSLSEISDRVDLFVDPTDRSLRVSALLNGMMSMQPRAGQISRADAEAAARVLLGARRLARHVCMVFHSMKDATVSVDDGMRHGQFWSSASVVACVSELVVGHGQCLSQCGVVPLTVQ